jgi:hypothetical protein
MNGRPYSNTGHDIDPDLADDVLDRLSGIVDSAGPSHFFINNGTPLLWISLTQSSIYLSIPSRPITLPLTMGISSQVVR